MAYTQKDLDTLKEAYARGVLEAWLPDGSRVRYQSAEHLRTAIADIQRELSGKAGLNAKKNTLYPTHSRGFHG
jgi:hypothetical protein